MASEPGAVFVFGKLPAHGDFVSRGLSDAAREAWDSWATAALERLRDGHPDFEDAHDAAAPWRFVAGPSTLGPGWRAGALAASVDSAGRRFIVAAGVEASPLARDPETAAEVEEALYLAIAERQTVDELQANIARRIAALVDVASFADRAARAPDGPGLWWAIDSQSPPRIGATPPLTLLCDASAGQEETIG